MEAKRLASESQASDCILPREPKAHQALLFKAKSFFV